MNQHRKAVCSLVIRDDGLILAVSRKDDPNAFGLPGGKVDPEDKSLEFAAARELLEETNVAALHGIPIYTTICKGDKDYVTTTFMWHEIIGDPEQVEGEGRVCWVSPDVLTDPIGIKENGMHHYNRELFNRMNINFYSAKKRTIIET